MTSTFIFTTVGKANTEQKPWLWLSLLAALLLSDLVGITGCHLVYEPAIYFPVPQRIQIDSKIMSPKALYFINQGKNETDGIEGNAFENTQLQRVHNTQF